MVVDGGFLVVAASSAGGSEDMFLGCYRRLMVAVYFLNLESEDRNSF